MANEFPFSPSSGGGGSLDAPPSPPQAGSNTSSLGWASKPDAGMGPEASDPQVMALQGAKLIEMGAQVLGSALPQLAAPLQAFVQQLQTVVPQLMSQGMGGGPASPSPVPAQPSPMGPQGGGAPM